MQTFVIILAVIAIYLFVTRVLPSTEGFNGSESVPQEFGDLTQHIAWNNGISWDNLPNPYIDQTLKGRRSPVVALAHGFPLSHEEHSTVPVKKSMVHFEDHACRPECCLTSSFSCSKGCICWTPPKEPDHPVRRNEKITPTS
jgi:hypothetical protein